MFSIGWMWVQISLASTPVEAPSLDQQREVTVEYTLSFDMDAKGDAACKMTKICDCSAVYRGEGTRVQTSSGHVSFKGTWTKVQSDCSPNLEPWVPEAGNAYHTIRWTQDARKVSEWLVHADLNQNRRLESDIKAGRQYWVSDIETAIDPATRTVTYVEKTQEMISIFSIESVHELTLRFTK